MDRLLSMYDYGDTMIIKKFAPAPVDYKTIWGGYVHQINSNGEMYYQGRYSGGIRIYDYGDLQKLREINPVIADRIEKEKEEISVDYWNSETQEETWQDEIVYRDLNLAEVTEIASRRMNEWFLKKLWHHNYNYIIDEKRYKEDREYAVF